MVEDAEVIEGARAIGFTLGIPAVSMLGVVDDLLVDRAFVAHSTPLWIDSRAPVVGGTGTAPWRHLVIAQDTGGGIVGPIRADLYWGDDQASVDVAGRMGGPGRYWLLLPRSLPVPVAPPATDPPAP